MPGRISRGTFFLTEPSPMKRRGEGRDLTERRGFKPEVRARKGDFCVHFFVRGPRRQRSGVERVFQEETKEAKRTGGEWKRKMPARSQDFPLSLSSNFQVQVRASVFKATLFQATWPALLSGAYVSPATVKSK